MFIRLARSLVVVSALLLLFVGLTAATMALPKDTVFRTILSTSAVFVGFCAVPFVSIITIAQAVAPGQAAGNAQSAADTPQPPTLRTPERPDSTPSNPRPRSRAA